MGIFDIFKSKQQNNSEALEDYDRGTYLFELRFI